jgi:predicted MPP superfamily phosphohydrolase
MDFASFINPHRFTVETVHLKLARLPRTFSGFRMAQISDIHMGGWMNRSRFQRVADLVAEQKPDVLLMTGDFLMGRSFPDIARQWLNDLEEVLSPLAASIPSFAVLGNHDFWTNPVAVRETLRRCGVTDLTNAVHTLTREGEHLHLCGVDDMKEGVIRLDKVIDQLRDDSAAILLVHEPDFADKSAATGKFDLQVSCHSHGGQIVIPFWGPPILPRTGRKYHTGLYKVGNMFQYTTRGVGVDRMPIRFNCPPEITLFELTSSQ